MYAKGFGIPQGLAAVEDACRWICAPDDGLADVELIMRLSGQSISMEKNAVKPRAALSFVTVTSYSFGPALLVGMESEHEYEFVSQTAQFETNEQQ